MPEISLFFGALLAVVQIPMTLAVGFRRRSLGISFLDGGDKVLLKRMRAHANFTETVPVAIIAMAGAEVFGLSEHYLWVGGCLILFGRLAHYLVVQKSDSGAIRFAMMLFTLVPIAGFALSAIYSFLT